MQAKAETPDLNEDFSENLPEKIVATVPLELDAQRLDKVAVELFPDYSRARLQAWVKSGALRVDGANAKSKNKVTVGNILELTVELEPQQSWQAEDIDLQIEFDDEHLIIVNKPVGLVVHPGAGNTHGTMANALLYRFPELEHVPRAGIVHRLDKDTSGLLVVAKTLPAHQLLVQQLQARTVKREYFALVYGVPALRGAIDAPIGRHPKQRQKMAVREHGGKPAITHFKRTRQFNGLASLVLRLETGRTHQIRVHMAAQNHPLIGDRIYGGNQRGVPKTYSPELSQAIKNFPRQALHAQALALDHPGTGERCEWRTELPDDLSALMTALKNDADDSSDP